MRKSLAAALSIIAVISISFAVYAEEAPEEITEEVIEETVELPQYVPYDPATDPTRINPSPLDEIIRRKAQQNQKIIDPNTQTSDHDDAANEDTPKEQTPQRRKTKRTSPPQNTSTRKSSNPFEQDNNNSIQLRNNNSRPYSGSRQAQQNRKNQARAAKEQAKKNSVRRWQNWDDVKDKWHSKSAAYQFTNWVFTPDQVTVQLVDRRGKVINDYTIYPLEEGNPDSGYELGEPVKAGTQIVVPDGCIVQGDPRHVNRNENPAIFGTGEIMYFKSDDRGAGFTIFPYDHGRWRYQIGL